MKGAAPRIGWVVDAQVDFLNPAGRLYVRDLGDPEDPGSAQVVPALARAVGWMREHCEVVVYTGDWHGLDDEEISTVAPDPSRGTYPPHCMGRSTDADERAGAEIIPEIRPPDPLVVEIEADLSTVRQVAMRALAERRPVFIRKNRFDVFAGNSATEAFLAALCSGLAARPEVIVAGVARDVCVTHAVDGLQARGYAVTALSDATWGLGFEPEAATLARWAKRGRVSTVAEL